MRDYTTDNPAFSKKIRIVEESDLVNAENDAAASKQLLQNDLVLLARMDKCLGSVESGLELDEAIQADTLIGAVNEVFRLGSENKQKLVENLTAMGVAASTDDTWGMLLDKILDMTDTSKDTVTAAALLFGYTAHDAAGAKITGALADKSGTTDHSAAVSLDTANKRLKLKVPATAKYGAENYLYAAYSAVASLIGLTPAKLVRNNTILEITGNSGNMDTSGATAAAADILSGKKAGVNGSMVTGSMTNRGAWTGATTGNGNVAIPAGYHNGSGYVSGAGAYNKGVSDADGRVNTGSTNYRTGYNAGVSATKVGTAGTGDVLAGKTFTNTGSVGASGTMANKGGATVDARAVTQDDTYTYLTVPANGYYNTSSRLKAVNSNLFQNAKIKVYRTSLKMSKAGSSITIGSNIQRIIYFHMDARKNATVNYSPILGCKLNDDGTVTFSVKCTNTDGAYAVYIYVVVLESSDAYNMGTVHTKSVSGTLVKDTENIVNFTADGKVKSIVEYTAEMINGAARSYCPALEAWIDGNTVYSTLYEKSDGTPKYNATVKYTML